MIIKKIRTYQAVAIAALIVAGCSSDIDLTKVDAGGNAVYTSEVNIPISFGTYLSRNTETRAGMTGEIKDEQLKQPINEESNNGGGFGIIAYYTDNKKLTDVSKEGGFDYSDGPNYMYNQPVSWNSTGGSDGNGAWEYSPIKYWPNETGTDGTSPAATSSATDYLSFFAYAPYVKVTQPADDNADKMARTADYIAYKKWEDGGKTGDEPALPGGIIGISSNSSTDGPIIEYRVSGNAKDNVDLLWGVSSTDKWENVTGNAQTLTVGKPYIDLIKPAVNQNVSFKMVHALARIELTADGVFDEEQHSSGSARTRAEDEDEHDIRANSIITVESVTLSGKRFARTGKLCLNNTEVDANNKSIAKWEDKEHDSDSGSEIVIAQDNLNDEIEYLSEASEGKTIGDAKEGTAGVTKTEKNVIAKTGDKPNYYMVIPGDAKEPLYVTVTYYVKTKDPNVRNGYTIVKNSIKKKLSATDIPLDAGTSTKLQLHLGMTTVKVNAIVSPWDTTDDTNVDLPKNAE